jgi:iron complex outermembrane receptor protein
MNLNSVRKSWAALALFLGVGLSSVAVAQTAPAAAPAVPQEVKMEAFVVTGSYLPPAANSVAIPVISVDANTIQNSGNDNSLLDVLRKTVPQFQGSANLGSTNANISSGFTQGGAQIALRNTSTLVLINGRRVAFNPADAQGNFQFVDLNMIPVAAVERVEVLADGASAIYGSDAVSGVVNIILKSNYEGFEVGGRYGWSTDQGHYAERTGYIVGGVDNGKTSMTISAEWVKVDPIWNFERPYSAVTFGTPTFAGSVNVGSNYYYLDPSLNAPTVAEGGLPAATLVANGTYSGPRNSAQQFQLFNLSQYVTQTVGNQREAMTIDWEHKITDNLKVFGDIMYVHTNTFSQINGQPINSSALAALAPDPTIPGSGGSSIPAGLYGNPFNVSVTARNRLVNNPRQYINDDASIRAVAGLRGQISSDWSWEFAGTYNRITEDYSNPGVINNVHLANAIINGDFNFFARTQKPGILEGDGIVGTATGSFISKLSNWDFKIMGKLFDLPGGPADIAIGGEYRKEFLSGIADPLSVIDPVTGQLGWNGATTFYPFRSSRRVESVFAELRLPLLKDVPGAHYLEVSGAVRHEAYSDTTGPTVPKLTLRYLPFNDEFALRGTYSKSFSAPTLYSLYGPVGIGFSDAFDLTPHNGGPVISSYQVNQESGANSKLLPSKSTNYTLGFVYSPKAVKGFSVSVDYWNIKQTDLVGAVPTNTQLQDVENLGAASRYGSQVHIGSFTGPLVTAPGQVSGNVGDNIYFVDLNTNIAKQDLDGFDVAAKYTYNNDTMGRFDLSTAVSIYHHYTFQAFPEDTVHETVGRSTDWNGTIPRWQSYSSLNYTRGNYEAIVGWRFLPGITDDDDGTVTGSFQTWDVAFAYRFGPAIKLLSNAKVQVGVNNVFNKFGPLDPAIFSDSNVDTGTYGSIGRFVYVDLKYKF